MDNNTAKFTNKNKEKLILMSVAVILFVICLAVSQWIMPENCYLFDNRIKGFLCDGVDLSNPTPCLTCEDDLMVSISQIMFGLGFSFLLIPFLFYGIRNWRNRSDEQLKLFD